MVIFFQPFLKTNNIADHNIFAEGPRFELFDLLKPKIYICTRESNSRKTRFPVKILTDIPATIHEHNVIVNFWSCCPYFLTPVQPTIEVLKPHYTREKMFRMFTSE